MSKTISITVPDPIYEALAAKGLFYDMSAGEALKSFLHQSAEIEESRLFIKTHIDQAKALYGSKVGRPTPERTPIEQEEPEKATGPTEELALTTGDEPSAN